MVVYIAGRITGQFDYYKRFRKAERSLRAMGHITINPARLPVGIKDYMSICKALIDQADAVYFMHDWKESVGAREEFDYAVKMDKALIYEQQPEAGDMTETEYWHREAIKNAAELGELKIKIAEAAEKAGVTHAR